MKVLQSKVAHSDTYLKLQKRKVLWSKCGGIARWAIFLHSPLESKLSDSFVWNANSFALRTSEVRTIHTNEKEKRSPQG
jgi:hypothetical protein